MIAIIADDHPLFRVALSQALQIILGPAAELYQAHSMAQLWPLLRTNPDTQLILLDLKLPDAEGFAGLTATGGKAFIVTDCDPEDALRYIGGGDRHRPDFGATGSKTIKIKLTAAEFAGGAADGQLTIRTDRDGIDL